MNEPAFPRPSTAANLPQDGMTLRDYFAAKAMQGFQEQWVYDNSDDLACKAYALADAMLKARQA
jgi:hypothetical protein